MRVAIGSDRRGFKYKRELIKHLKLNGHEVVDVGTYDEKYPVDYPIYGEAVGKKIVEKVADRGVVICATGIGIMIACNKVKGIRCGMAYGDEVTKLMREHNDANVIAFGQDHMCLEDVKRRLDIFLSTEFLGDYHISRIEQITSIENEKEIFQTSYIDIV